MSILKTIKSNTVGDKIKNTFIKVSIAVAFLGGIGCFVTNYSKSSYRELYALHGEARQLISNTCINFESIKAHLTDMVATPTDAIFKARVEGMKNLFKENNEYLNEYLKICPEELKDSVKEYQANLNKYNDIALETADYIIAGDTKKAMHWLGEELYNVACEITEAKNKIVEYHDVEGKKTLEKLDNVTTLTLLSICATSISIVAYVLICGKKLFKDIEEPTVEILNFLENLTTGDLTKDLSIDADNEFGKIATALDKMTKNTNYVLNNVSSISEQVFSGAANIAQSSQGLAEGATEQASALEQLTSSIERIAEQTELNAKNAEKAREFVLQTKNGAVSGNKQMDEMVEATKEIQQASAAISNIIDVIDGIAFQTNILALNAAVEAARAGVHGKGFAVVADEVRTLAVRSAEAVKQTTTLIENSMEKAEKGSQLAMETSESLKAILSDVVNITGLIEDISASSNEQFEGISQINIGINQVSEVIQTTSAVSEENAAASQELNSQAQGLEDEMSKFKLR